MRQRLVELSSEERDILLVTVVDVASGSNRELVLGDGQALREGHLRPRRRLQAEQT